MPIWATIQEIYRFAYQLQTSGMALPVSATIRSMIRFCAGECVVNRMVSRSGSITLFLPVHIRLVFVGDGLLSLSHYWSMLRKSIEQTLGPSWNPSNVLDSNNVWHTTGSAGAVETKFPRLLDSIIFGQHSNAEASKRREIRRRQQLANAV